MSHFSRRKLITTGLAAAAGVAGLGAAERIAQRYGLIPPDHGGIYGLGETLTYASQRLLTRHSLARELGQRLDQFLTAQIADTSRARVQMLLEEWKALVNGTSTLMMNKGQEQ